MQFDINIRLYEYWHEQDRIRKKRWNNKEIKKFYWKWICKQKVRKKGGGKSVSQVPVSAVIFVYKTVKAYRFYITYDFTFPVYILRFHWDFFKLRIKWKNLNENMKYEQGMWSHMLIYEWKGKMSEVQHRSKLKIMIQRNTHKP